MRMQTSRTILLGIAGGLLLFLPWTAFRYFWFSQVPYNHAATSAHLTDVEYETLEIRPGSDLYLMLGLAGFAGGLSLLFCLRQRTRRKSAAWALAAVSFLLVALSIVYVPVLIFSDRLPGASLIHGPFERIAWTYLLGLILVWILTVGILWAAVARVDREGKGKRRQVMALKRSNLIGLCIWAALLAANLLLWWILLVKGRVSPELAGPLVVWMALLFNFPSCLLSLRTFGILAEGTTDSYLAHVFEAALLVSSYFLGYVQWFTILPWLSRKWKKGPADSAS